MGIHTREDYERVRAKLMKFQSTELADLILDLAVGDRDASELVEIFAERDNVEANAEKLKAAIVRLQGEDEYIPHTQSFEFSRRLDKLIERIEKDLLPLSPDAALEVLADFIQLDGSLSERVDEAGFAVTEPMKDASELFARAVEQGADRKHAELLFRKLVEKDDYGCRSFLVNQQSRILGAG